MYRGTPKGESRCHQQAKVEPTESDACWPSLVRSSASFSAPDRRDRRPSSRLIGRSQPEGELRRIHGRIGAKGGSWAAAPVRQTAASAQRVHHAVTVSQAAHAVSA